MILFCLNQNSRRFQFRISPINLALPAQASSVAWGLVVMKEDVNSSFILRPPPSPPTVGSSRVPRAYLHKSLLERHSWKEGSKLCVTFQLFQELSHHTLPWWRR